MAHRSSQPSEPELAVSPAEAARRSGLGRTTIFAAIKDGDLKSIKIGARRLIMVDSLKTWLTSHEAG